MATVTRPGDPEAQIISKKTRQIEPPQPFQPSVMSSVPPPQNDYLCLSIISFFFFILLAVPALFFSIKTRNANHLGNHRKAKRNSRLALGFGISSIVMGSTLLISIRLLFHLLCLTW
uniref:Transmembrane protein n=1 Tax=Spermophilus dauricus TaxID=99837 RepID=A0A8C9PJW8_SPEDA